MPVTYYRTERTIAVALGHEETFEVRTYAAAASPQEARAQSRAAALSVFPAGAHKATLGAETVIDVPGVTAERPPEVRVQGRWLRVMAKSAHSGDA